MKKINVGLVGYGFSGRVFHLPPMLENDKYNIKKIMARSEKNVNDIKVSYPEFEIVSNFDDIINDSKIDLVVIATANEVHYEYTKKALEMKKHVVCEKPFVEKYEDALKLFELAKKNNVILRVFHNRKYDGDINTLKELIKEKDFGRLISFSTRFDRYRPEVNENWRFKEGNMAGIFYDLAPHLVHHVIELFGIPNSVSNSLFFDRKGETDDHFEMQLNYDNGFTCFLGAEMFERDPKPRLELVATKGTYVKYGFDSPDTTNAPFTDIYQDDKLRSEFIDENLNVEKIPLLKGKHYLFYEKLGSGIIDDTNDDVDTNLALAVIMVMQKALEAAKYKKTIEI